MLFELNEKNEKKELLFSDLLEDSPHCGILIRFSLWHEKMTGPQIYTKFTRGGRVQKRKFLEKNNLYILRSWFSPFFNLKFSSIMPLKNFKYKTQSPVLVKTFDYLNRRLATYTQNSTIIDMLLALLTQCLQYTL